MPVGRASAFIAQIADIEISIRIEYASGYVG